MQLVILHIQRGSRFGVSSDVMKERLSLLLNNYFNIQYTSFYKMNKSKSVCEPCDDTHVLKNTCFTFARDDTEKVESKTK